MNGLKLHCDFETRSAVDLVARGIDVYSNSPTTNFIVLGYAFDGEAPAAILAGQPLPDRVRFHVESGLPFVAHNAAFEYYIWNNVCARRYGWPKLKYTQLECTMAQGYALGIPGSLEKAAAAVGIKEQKDLAGSRVMLQLSHPREVLDDGSIIWWDDEDKHQKLINYCLQDVRVEMELSKRLLQLTERERKVWQLDFRINHRGVAVDLDALIKAQEIAKNEKKRLNVLIEKLTNNVVSTCDAVGQIKFWAKNKGVELDSLDKNAVSKLLENPEIPSDVKAVLKLRQESAKSSNAKIVSMINSASADSRIRGVFQYHGSTTGRWAGRRIQPQNFPRPVSDQETVDQFISDVKSGSNADYLRLAYGPPLSIISDSLRGFIVSAKGHDFIAADFSSIEARVLAWLAGEEKVLDIFKKNGDVYKYAAARIYNKPADEVTKDERQVGKVAVLALGYQGGKVAFQTMAKGYKVAVTDDQAESIKLAWRNNHPKIVRYWHDLETAAKLAINNPNSVVKAGPPQREVKYLKSGSFLFCILPSKRGISYPYAKIDLVDTPWGEQKEGITYLSENSLTRKWEKHVAYGGLFAENITQGVSRDVMVEALFRLEEKKYFPVMHIHDEVVTEVPEGFGSVTEMEQLMSTQPDWAKGLPISAEGWRGKRFRK